MSSYKNPPEFNSKLKPYDRYVEELKAWCIVTDLEKKKQGVAIALSLPENDPSGVRDKVFNELTLENLNNETGVTTLINYFNTLFLKDELSEVYERYIKFDRYFKDASIKMEDYILEFEKLYNRINQKEMTLPPSVLAFKLLDGAKLSHRDRQLVLTGVDYSERRTLFVQMKKALRKFHGDQAIPISDQNTEAPVKVEPVLYNEDEALYMKSTPYRKQNRYFNPQFRQQQQQLPSQSNYRGAFNNQQMNQYDRPLQAAKPERPTNPRGFNGKPLKCKICESILHLMRDCPHRNSAPNSENIILYTGTSKPETCLLTSEARNSAVLDSGCTSTVAGKIWIDCYLQSLPDQEARKVIRDTGSKIFKFGGGETKQSMETITFPCTLAGKHISIKTDVVESDIPLLLSKSAMKQAGIKLDLINDTAEIFGNTVSLNSTTSGHYCLPLSESSIDIEECNFNVHCTEPNKFNILKKIHGQFAHPTKDKLKRLMKDANIWDEEYELLAEKIYESCEICKQFKKTPPRPAVALPLAHEFNDAVAIDLKHWKDNRYILYMIDMFSRFTLACIITDKKPNTIINCIMQTWIGSGMGAPKKFLADNGGEFANKDFTDMCENLNIFMMNTAAESPWQNGLCERNHAVVDRCLEKILEDNPCLPLATALSWALNAKNSLQMWCGFSSYQLVYGKNPNIPSVMTDAPPALEGRTINSSFAEHINTLHAARHAYIQAESSEKVRKALRHKIRTFTTVFEQGCKVYYKRDTSNKWQGPGIVIGQDGKIILIRHGSFYVRVSANRIIKAGTEFQAQSNGEQDQPISKNDQIITNLQTNESDSEDEKRYTDQEGNTCNKDTEKSSTPTANTAVNIQTETTDKKYPVKNDRILYQLSESDTPKQATVLSRAGKVTGKYKSFYNIHNEGETNPITIDFDSVYSWEKQSEKVNITEISSDLILHAKLNEIQNWKRFNVFSEINDIGQTKISTRWVITKKNTNVKARLVAKGFQEQHSFPADSPTVSKSTLRIMLSLSTLFGWTCKTTDVKAAFLQSHPIDREIYLEPPPESNCTGKVWKLNKAVYGLTDAARQWFDSVKDAFASVNCIQSKYDPTLFYWYHNKELQGMTSIHVDDFIHAGTKLFDEHVLNRLHKVFEIGKTAETSFKYIGLDISHSNNTVIISQKEYADSIKFITISSQRKSEKFYKLNSDEEFLLRSVIGQANWLANQTRPDISFDVLTLSSNINKDPTVNDLLEANKMIKKIKSRDSKILYPCLGSINDLKIVVFTDASYANLPDGASSAGAYVILLVGKNNVANVLSWCSNKIKRVVNSTTAAEALSLVNGLEETIYLRAIMCNILNILPNKIPIEAIIDNKNLHSIIYSTKQIGEKRLRIDIANVKEMIARGEIYKITWKPTIFQISDCLTKKGATCDRLFSVISTGKYHE